MVELIVTDLDRTLLSDEKQITGYTARVLRRCRERGIKVAFATARPERTTKAFQRLFEPDYVISNNGATLSTPRGALHYEKCIPADIRDALLSRLIALEEVTCLAVEAGDCQYSNYQGEPWGLENWNLVYHDFREPLRVDTPKISVECQSHSLIAELVSGYESLHLYLNSGESWMQIMHTEATKMNGVRYMSRLLGISIENIAAFGDDYNDIEMLTSCGIGVAVGNAIEPARQAASYVCLDNHQDGVARWIQAHLLSL